MLQYRNSYHYGHFFVCNKKGGIVIVKLFRTEEHTGKPLQGVERFQSQCIQDMYM